MTRILTLISLLVLSTACIKTAEQVNREKRFNDQLRDSQGLLADMLTQMKDMQTQLDRLNGRLEEIEHRQGQVNPEKLKNMEETLNVLKAQKEADTTQLAQIQAELKEQRGFLEKVTTTLGSMNKSSSKKKSTKQKMIDGLELVKANKFAQARTELGLLDGHKDLNAADQNKVLHGLGRVEFYTKNYEKALVYFSKIFAKYPRSSLAPSSLLFIGKSLDKLGKKDEAREAFTKLTEDYPQSAEAKQAKKLL